MDKRASLKLKLGSGIDIRLPSRSVPLVIHRMPCLLLSRLVMMPSSQAKLVPVWVKLTEMKPEMKPSNSSPI